eukprot:5551672-Lingulodinium_polyedra.AAC.1
MWPPSRRPKSSAESVRSKDTPWAEKSQDVGSLPRRLQKCSIRLASIVLLLILTCNGALPGVESRIQSRICESEGAADVAQEGAAGCGE